MRLGIIGLGKLGEYYVRDFKKFKIDLLTIKNSSPTSSIKKTKFINKKYKTNLDPFPPHRTMALVFNNLFLCIKNFTTIS